MSGNSLPSGAVREDSLPLLAKAAGHGVDSGNAGILRWETFASERLRCLRMTMSLV
jgi:hypothetical protein